MLFSTDFHSNARVDQLQLMDSYIKHKFSFDLTVLQEKAKYHRQKRRFENELQEVTAFATEQERLKEEHQKNYSQLSLEHQRLQEIHEASQASSAILQEELEASRTESTILQERLATSQTEAEALKERLKASQAESAGLQESLRASQAESASLQESLRASQAESAGLQESLQASQAESERLREDYESLQRRFDSALAELQSCSHKSPQPGNISPWNVPRNEIQMLEEIGRGAWGTVMKGIFGREVVAIKLPHQNILNRRVLERLKRETRMMILICHPNLLKIIAVVFDRDAERLRQPPLIITELLDINLRQCYLQGRLRPDSRIPVFLDVAYGLQYMHTCQDPIIHRDVSAPNVLLKALPNGMWRAKVSDFGSANLARLSVTAGEGAIIYTAPEAFPQLHPNAPQRQQTTKMDVYSFGIMMCEVITEEQPNPELYQEKLKQVKRRSHPMHCLIVRCTNQDPNKRPAMAAIINELNKITVV